MALGAGVVQGTHLQGAVAQVHDDGAARAEPGAEEREAGEFVPLARRDVSSRLQDDDDAGSDTAHLQHFVWTTILRCSLFIGSSTAFMHNYMYTVICSYMGRGQFPS